MCKAPLSTVLCYQHTHFKRKWTSSLPVSISLRLNTCYSTYRNSQWLTFLCHIPKTRGYQKRCHFGFLGFPVFITSITLFPQLYKVVLIFFHSAENNEKLQRKCSVLGTENKKKTQQRIPNANQIIALNVNSCEMESLQWTELCCLRGWEGGGQSQATQPGMGNVTTAHRHTERADNI